MPLHPRVRAVSVVSDFTLRLTFRDGSVGTIDLGPMLRDSAGVFAPLRVPAAFADVRVDAEAGTIVWPNGADIDPDVLYAMAHQLVSPTY